MDSFGDLIPILIGAGYLALRFMGAKRKAAARDPNPAPARQRRKAGGPSVFEQLVARLEEQAAEARTAAQPTPPARQTRVAGETRLTEAPRRIGPSLATIASQGGFDSETSGYDHRATDYAHEQHGFGLDNPLSEEAFERASDADRRASRPDRQSYDPHGLGSLGEPSPMNPLVPSLRTPEALRKAFVLQTILTRRPTPKRASVPPAQP